MRNRWGKTVKEYCLSMMDLATYRCEVSPEKGCSIKGLEDFVSSVYHGPYVLTEQYLKVGGQQVDLPKDWTASSKKQVYALLMGLFFKG